MQTELDERSAIVKTTGATRFLIDTLIILLFSFIANLRSLKCFFFADDLLCLQYLYKIFHGDPGFLLQRLFSPWQDRSISLLYRPVCDLLLSFDYALAAANPFFYHLTNLLLHCLASIVLYSFVNAVLDKLAFASSRNLALLSALMFAVYPLHLEPIVWIVGRADLAATVFVLSSLLLMIKSSRQGRFAGVLGLVFYMLALLSKEAAACQLAIVLFYLLFLSDDRQFPSKTLQKLFPYLLVTLAYFVLRFSVLGNFIGGYTGSLADAVSWHWWERPLEWKFYSLLGLGVNHAIFSEGSPEVIYLRLSYLCLALVMFVRMFLSPWDGKTTRVLAFFALSSMAAILPAFQVIGVSAVLSNARVFYLASAFYIPLLVLSFIPLHGANQQISPLNNLLKLCASSLSLGIILTFTLISSKSYTPWLDASRLLIKLQSQIEERLLAGIQQNKKITVLNCYGNWKGAHLLYEFEELRALLGPNFFKQDFSGRLLALDEYPDFVSASTGRFKRLLRDPLRYELYCFDFKKLELSPLNFDGQNASTGISKLSISEPKSTELDECQYKVVVEPATRIDDNCLFEIDMEWHSSGQERSVGLCFSNDDELPPDESMQLVLLDKLAKMRDYRVASLELRRLVAGKAARNLYIRTRSGDKLLGVKMIPARYLAVLEPDLNSVEELQNANYFPLKNPALSLDVSQVPGACAMELELAKPDYLFDFGKVSVRDPQIYPHLSSRVRFNSVRAKYLLPADLLMPGFRYSYRLIALDKDGHPTGFYSDSVSFDLRSCAKR